MDYRIQENCLTIFLPRELDHHNAEDIRKMSDHLIERKHIKHVIFDFKGTHFMDSSGIGMLMGRYRLLHYSGGRVSAIHVNDRVNRIMRLSGIYKYIEISQEAVWHQKRR